MIFALFLAAFRLGAAPEKIIASLFLGSATLSRIYFWAVEQQPNLDSIDYGYLALDIVLTVVMVTVALRANRMYTLWMAGFQIIAVMAHFARGLSDSISAIAYVIMVVGPSYFQIIILGFGIWLHARRVRRHGNYRSWRSSSNLSPDRVR